MIRDLFEGLPLQAWAEKLGERVMPAYELIKEEQAAAKRAAKAMGKKVEQELAVPSIPHLLPFTRWCALPAPCLLPEQGCSFADRTHAMQCLKVALQRPHQARKWPAVCTLG